MQNLSNLKYTMKKILIVISLLITVSSFGQEDEKETKGKFRQDNIFVGGGIGLGIGGWSGGFNIGANPELGYTVSKWLDAGISTNFNYFSFRAEVNNGIRQRSFNYGGGVFARIFPFRGFFLQVLPEYNWINTNLRNVNSGGSEYKIRQQAPSLLLGVGYGSREIGRSNFFTVLMFDVGNNAASPYIDSYKAKLPILRTGFNIYLRPKRQR